MCRQSRHRSIGHTGLHHVADIGNGTYHSLALLKNGTTKAWGYNVYGQLGNNTTSDSSVPVTVT